MRWPWYKVVMDEAAGRMEVVVPDDQLSLAITGGANVRSPRNCPLVYRRLNRGRGVRTSSRGVQNTVTRSMDALNIDM